MSDNKPSAINSVRYIEIEEDQSGQRIDNFLRTALKGVPKSMIYRIIRKGEVRVNKKRIKPDGRIHGGDVVRIPPIRVPEPTDVPMVGKALLELLEQSILYESKALIVINKPSGLAVHGGSGINLGLIEAMRQLRPDERFLELVHRLDRDTSGCIMIAKKRSMLRHLHEALRQSRVNKVYHALVVGRWESKDSSVDAPLRKNELQSGERIVRVQPDGKASLTRFKVLRRFGTQATLVEAKPVTGRTHQIRVHTQFAGHPIIGDDKYGVESINRDMKKQGIKRLFLHSAMLEVTLLENEVLRVSAPLEQTLSSALERLADQQNKAYQEESE
ncbi:23S rRNA pseudouridine(955/2504/2580) synthase RluC [Neptunomonas qingdaonensis]|uniref:Pseudouridine synthase n=1 Tax=Neptunomonas qingdaonensis TaxID=1045558 RepID=A0A1I2TCH4_9GAMM|nr:23S rRNA pseudouridine(955/2504/2580) synthase RluC [Neptunomonas qingdaonensis]SFG61007.1 23S rRNA pseudouridine955/2504/2580 synthase [Neptunomonas qingdaonensis]